MKKEKNVSLRDELILQYRTLIKERYDPDVLNRLFDFPEEIEAKQIKELETFFLDYIYPHPDERARLEKSFEILREFTSQPAKIWFVLGNMASAIFKYGLLFPQALKAGYTAVDAYLKATTFEKKMVEAGVTMKLAPPLSREDFYACLRALTRPKMTAFVGDVCALFSLMSNVDLLARTLEIMNGVVEKMRKNPDRFTAEEADAIAWGERILRQGYALFSQLSRSARADMVEIIRLNEADFIDILFGAQAA